MCVVTLVFLAILQLSVASRPSPPLRPNQIAQSFKAQLANPHGGIAMFLGEGIFLSDTLVADVKGKSVSLRSVTPGRTIWDCQGKPGMIFRNVGLFTLSNISFVNCSVSPTTNKPANSADGGAVWVEAQAVSISGVTFTSCQAVPGMGGALYIKGVNPAQTKTRSTRKTFSIQNTVFQKNWAVGGGGAVALVNVSGNIVIKNTTFIGNSAESNGGAVLVLGASSKSVQVLNSTFDGNSAYGTGGGGLKIAESTANLTVSQCLFTGNRGFGTAGALAIKALKGSANLVKSSFLNNGVSDVGGAVSYYSSAGSLRVDRCTFQNNGGRSGGGLLLDGSDSSVILTGCVFQQNSAQYEGAALASSNLRGAVTVNKCLFKANKGSGACPVIQVTNSTQPWTIKNTKFVPALPKTSKCIP